MYISYIISKLQPICILILMKRLYAYHQKIVSTCDYGKCIIIEFSSFDLVKEIKKLPTN